MRTGDRQTEGETTEPSLVSLLFCVALVIGTLISLVQLVQIFVDTAIDFYVCRIYMRVEICLLTSLFKKVIQPDAPAPPAVILRSTHRTTYEDSQALPKPSGDRKTESRRKEKSIAPGRAVARGFQGNVFNLMFVDIPSLASLIFTFLDVAMLPVRLSLAAVMLYMQVRRRLTNCNHSFLQQSQKRTDNSVRAARLIFTTVIHLCTKA